MIAQLFYKMNQSYFYKLKKQNKTQKCFEIFFSQWTVAQIWTSVVTIHQRVLFYVILDLYFVICHT